VRFATGKNGSSLGGARPGEASGVEGLELVELRIVRRIDDDAAVRARRCVERRAGSATDS
jgi:hypothetical protein